jgi:hypothetical protein
MSTAPRPLTRLELTRTLPPLVEAEALALELNDLGAVEEALFRGDRCAESGVRLISQRAKWSG